MMEKIQHRMIRANGIEMHVAEVGEGPVVLFLHGFPELWYSWHRQMLFLSARGYRAVAPDLRGYGDTDAPPSPAAYTTLHIVGDLVALLDALGVAEQVFLVAHDFGAYHAWNFCLFRPDRVRALVSLSVPFVPRNPSGTLLDTWQAVLGDNFYICRFQEPGEAEEEFGRRDTPTMLKKLFTLFSQPRPAVVPKEIGFAGPQDEEVTSPPWLSEHDLNYYATQFDRTGFTGGLNYYRNIKRDWELTGAWTGAVVKVPVKFVMGEMDLTYHNPGVKEFIDSGGMKAAVPLLQECVIMEGAAHFLPLERPDSINAHIYDFIHKFQSN